MPRLPRAPKPKTIKEVTGNGGGRRAIGRAPRIAVVPVVLVAGLALSGCSADYWPTFGTGADASSASATATVGGHARPRRRRGHQAAGRDGARSWSASCARSPCWPATPTRTLDVDAIKTRFTGPALELREANYKVRATLPDYAAPDADSRRARRRDGCRSRPTPGRAS